MGGEIEGRRRRRIKALIHGKQPYPNSNDYGRTMAKVIEYSAVRSLDSSEREEGRDMGTRRGGMNLGKSSSMVYTGSKAACVSYSYDWGTVSWPADHARAQDRGQTEQLPI